MRSLVQLSIRLNPLVTAILRSRLHWLLSPGLMLITVTGRKSGRVYTIPVGYHQVKDAIIILVNEAPAKNWWRNFRQPGPIELLWRGKRVKGTAVIVPPGSVEFRERATASLQRGRFMNRVLGVDYDRANGLSDAQVKDLGARIAIVRVTLTA